MKKSIFMKLTIISILLLAIGCTKYKYYYVFKGDKAYREQIYKFYDGKLKIKVNAMYRIAFIVNQSSIRLYIENKSNKIVKVVPKDFQIASKYFHYQLRSGGSRYLEKEGGMIKPNSKAKIVFHYEDPYSSGMKKDEVLTIERFGLYVDGVELITEELHFSPKLEDIQDSGTPLNPEY